MKKPFGWLRISCLSVVGVLFLATLCSAEVIISEYVEGSSYNKAIEIYNPGETAVDLLAEGYHIDVFFNGNTIAGTSIELLGSIGAGETYVLADEGANTGILAAADQTTSSSLFNGDDAVVLYRNSEVIDCIGQVGVDPGSQWGDGDLSTQNNTLRRSVDITAGDTDPSDEFDLSGWEGFPQDTVDGLGVHDGNGNSGTPEEVFIHDIQGSDDTSPLVGSQVIVEGIVTADFQGSSGLGGFFLQEEDTDSDADPLTSEGIFVYDASFGVDVAVGERVSVAGTVAEYYNLTEITTVTDIQILASSQSLPALSQVELPIPDPDLEPYYLEAVEGMRVSLPQTLTVSETYNLGRYGELLLSSGRLLNPTNVAAPGDPALAIEAGNALNHIVLDDASTQQNPDPIVYPDPGLSADNTVRCGHTVDDLTGVMSYSNSAYRIHPTQTPVFEAADNPRTEAPDAVGGRLKVASFNVLNYFNGDGQGGGFPTSRGADTAAEFKRQREKIVSAILAMGADVIGLMEIENDGYESTSAIADLVDALNAGAPSGHHYGFVDPGTDQLGSDEIAVGLIYDTLSVEETGTPATIAAGAFADNNRQPLAQTFSEMSSGETFTVVVNHFKSKGSACDDAGDPDTGDGQGNCNLTRVAAAEALTQWIATSPTGSDDEDILVIGDLNAYALEDPITVFKDADYTDLVHQFVGDAACSYIYDGEAGYLDHALATASMATQVAGVTEWHINADEPRVLDYNAEYKSDDQIDSLYSADAYRASDHDPVIIGLQLSGGATASLYATLGDAANGARDIDIYRFYGQKDEQVTISLAAVPTAAGQGKRAGLDLCLQSDQRQLLKVDRSVLPNTIEARLLTDGYYLIRVIRGMGRQGYEGDYCISLNAAIDTADSLEPFALNE